MKFIYSFLFLTLSLTLFSQQNNDAVFVSDLDLKYVDQPWWTPQKNKAINGQEIKIAGKKFCMVYN